MEAVLSPDTTLTGKTLRQIRFRNKYDLTVLAIRRKGKVIHQDRNDIPLKFGDALLLHGKRSEFSILGPDPDFLVLTEAVQDVPRTGKLWLSVIVFSLTLLSVIFGFLPIYIAAVIGSAFMVMTAWFEAAPTRVPRRGIGWMVTTWGRAASLCRSAGSTRP